MPSLRALGIKSFFLQKPTCYCVFFFLLLLLSSPLPPSSRTELLDFFFFCQGKAKFTQEVIEFNGRNKIYSLPRTNVEIQRDRVHLLFTACVWCFMAIIWLPLRNSATVLRMKGEWGEWPLVMEKNQKTKTVNLVIYRILGLLQGQLSVNFTFSPP